MNHLDGENWLKVQYLSSIDCGLPISNGSIREPNGWRADNSWARTSNFQDTRLNISRAHQPDLVIKLSHMCEYWWKPFFNIIFKNILPLDSLNATRLIFAMKKSWFLIIILLGPNFSNSYPFFANKFRLAIEFWFHKYHLQKCESVAFFQISFLIVFAD